MHFTGPTFTVEGSLSLTTPDGPIELAMDDDSCFAADVRSSETTRQAPRGRPLSNDAIEDALLIAIGSPSRPRRA